MQDIDPQSAHADMAADGGWGSRKFWGFVLISGLIFLAGVVAASQRFALFKLETVIEGLILMFTIMCGANVATKFGAVGILKAAMKAASGETAADPAAPPPADKPAA